MRRFVSGSRYANVTATLALVVALGGTGYAATALPRGSVGGKQLKAGAVTGVKVKDGSLTATDFQTGPQGLPIGPQGAPGQQGSQGVQGPAGPFPTLLPAGKTVTGSFYAGGGSHSTANQQEYAVISFPFPLAAKPQQSVVGYNQPPTASCPGSAAAPTAAPGFVCFYPRTKTNLAVVSPFLYDPATGDSGPGRTGVLLAVQSAGDGSFTYFGTWAVTG